MVSRFGPKTSNSAPVDLAVLEDVPAGRVATRRVDPGTAIKIMTGAPIPEGADAVVRVEDTSQTGDVVTIHVGVPPGTSVRRAGGDIEEGTEVVGTGFRLTPAHIGVLANRRSRRTGGPSPTPGGTGLHRGRTGCGRCGRHWGRVRSATPTGRCWPRC